MTQEMIDAVFADPILRQRFTDPEKAKAICEARLQTGAALTKIGKAHGVSTWYCCDTIRRVKRLYIMNFEEGDP